MTIETKDVTVSLGRQELRALGIPVEPYQPKHERDAEPAAPALLPRAERRRILGARFRPLTPNKTKHNQYSLTTVAFTEDQQAACIRAGIAFRRAPGLDETGNKTSGWVIIASGRAQRRAAASILKEPRARWVGCKPSATLKSLPKATAEGNADRNRRKRERRARRGA